MRHPILAIAAAFLLGAGAASASPITFAFTGAIDNDPFGVFGTAAFSGSYTFDSATAQVLNTPSSVGYAGSGGIFSLSVSFTETIGGTLDGVPFLGDTLNITVNNDFPGPVDEYLVTSTSSVDSALSMELRLDDGTGTAFSNILLPLAPPSLAGFSSRRFAFFAGTLDNPLEAEGTVLTLTCTSGCMENAVPEPSSATLLVAAGGVLLWLRRKIRRDAPPITSEG
jgi:hypothetical protein